MNSALYSGLSGTVAHQVRMDVAANNLANVSTAGYKAQRVGFEDAFYQTLRLGRPDQNGYGGVSPIQVGTGVSVGAITTLFSQGALQSTGQSLDAAISGDGMFIVSGPDGTFYSRDGQFQLDDTNTLVMSSTGLKVQGWMGTDGTVTPTGGLTDLTFPLQTMRAPKATTALTLAGNLPADLKDGATATSSVDVYDSLGNTHAVDFTFTKTGDNAWSVDVTCEGTTTTSALTFKPDGSLDTGGTISLGPVTMPTGADDLTVDIDLTKATQFAGTSDIAATEQDGYGAAPLQGVTITDGGVVTGNYPDGRSMPLAQLAMATFPDMDGLLRSGNSLYSGTAASGLAQVGAAATSGRGNIIGGSLEMSNTDMTSSFLEMLVTQRAYQASTRVITMANNLLDEAVRILDR